MYIFGHTIDTIVSIIQTLQEVCQWQFYVPQFRCLRTVKVLVVIIIHSLACLTKAIIGLCGEFKILVVREAK